MAEIKLYIATSLDGYIARKNNSLDWLNALQVPEGEDFGYGEFYSGIDTVLMGANTYKEVLSFGVDWPYEDCKSYVISRHGGFDITTPKTERIEELDLQRVEELQKESQKGIWLVGGGQLINQFLLMEKIDRFVITIIPILLGEGIPLFPEGFKDVELELEKVESMDPGVVNLFYKKK